MCLAVAAYGLFGWPLPFVAAASLLVGLLGDQVEGWLATRYEAKLESQLADAIDLMIGALGSGASLFKALEVAAAESRRPLRSYLDDVLGRIRYGDDARVVLHGLYQRLPRETFLLFTSALAVQWETGGSLAASLATVGRTIRDRIELTRRVRSNATQSQASTVVVLVLTYFIAAVVWRTNPDQMTLFLSSSLGQWLAAGAILLQAVGIVWMAAISRMRY
jgi:tight adherence protein B